MYTIMHLEKMENDISGESIILEHAISLKLRSPKHVYHHAIGEISKLHFRRIHACN